MGVPAQVWGDPSELWGAGVEEDVVIGVICEI